VQVKEAHKAEVVTFLKGTVIRCAEESADMYASVDAVTDRLAQKLRKYKERRLEGYHGGPNMGENLAEVLEALGAEDAEEAPAADEEFVDPEAPVVTKIKR
jgi:putative sigma-54 modulation protein